jgi:hypothetical protein
MNIRRLSATPADSCAIPAQCACPAQTGTSVPELTNEHFGAVITSDQPIAMQRALYWHANGQI